MTCKSRLSKTPGKGLDLESPALLRILRLLDEFVYLRTDQIVRLSTTHERYVKEKLRRMWDNNLIVRIPPPAMHYPIIYTLDGEGANLLLKTDGQVKRWKPAHKRRAAYAKGWWDCEHTIMANEVLIRMMEARHMIGVKLGYEHYPKGMTKTEEVVFDKHVVVENTHVFVEADTGTQRPPVIQGKVSKYVNYILEFHQWDAVVLFVTTKARRAIQIKTVIERYCDRQGYRNLAQLFRIVALGDATSDTILTEPIFSIGSRKARYPLLEPINLTLHADMKRSEDDLV